jgi:predicted DNA-binding antitoxin AbrB/MazE fold protein
MAKILREVFLERVVEAVYEHGVLTPVEPLDLPEHQRVILTIQVPELERADAILGDWEQVYGGLPEQDVNEIERIALDRSLFMRQER